MPSEPAPPYWVVLGIAQDGGYPQAGCAGECCAPAWADATLRRHVACGAIIDPRSGERWLVDATPDFREQLRVLDGLAPAAPGNAPPGLAGILLTHGHIGHYTGLMHLGREVMGTVALPVYASVRLAAFLRRNEPWSTLERDRHIVLHEIEPGTERRLNGRLAITPLPVPHRDEHTDTFAFKVSGPDRSVLYLPDIDAWEEWSTSLAEALESVDTAYLDGTFFGANELPDRDPALVPHPTMLHTLEALARLPAQQRAKVRFMHLNHSNPAMDLSSPERNVIHAIGCRVADELERTLL